MEALIVFSVSALLCVLTFTTFSDVYKSHALDKTRITAVSLLEQARSNSMASRDSLQYGVHFASSTITIFEGSVYAASATSNNVFYMSPFVELSTSTINGGGQDIVFGRLTGTTSDSGSLTFSLSSNASTTKSVIVHPTGIIE